MTSKLAFIFVLLSAGFATAPGYAGEVIYCSGFETCPDGTEWYCASPGSGGSCVEPADPRIVTALPDPIPTAGVLGEFTLEGLHFGEQLDAIIVLMDAGLPSEVDLTSGRTFLLSDTAIAGLNFPAGTGTHSITVYRGGYASLPFTVYYQAPVINQVSTTAGTKPATGGFTITLNGDHFGTDAGVTEVYVGNLSGSQECVQYTVPQTAQTIECAAPAWGGIDQTVTVVVDSLKATSTFSYDPPTLTSAQPAPACLSDCCMTDESDSNKLMSCPNTGGQSIFLVGTNFGPVNGPPISVTVGGSPCLNPTVTTPNVEIECLLPAGAGLDQVVVVTVGGASVEAALVSYLPPS